MAAFVFFCFLEGTTHRRIEIKDVLKSERTRQSALAGSVALDVVGCVLQRRQSAATRTIRRNKGKRKKYN
jgi:hypothetical protein